MSQSMYACGNCWSTEDGSLGMPGGAGQVENDGQTGQVEATPVERHGGMRECGASSGASSSSER